MPTVEETIKALEKLKQEVPALVGTEAVTFFKQGFKKGGFTGNTLVLWKKGFKPLGATLVGKGSHLLNSIDKIKVTANSVTVGSIGIRYAKLHNEGAVLPITAKQRAYFWAMYYELVKANTLKNNKQRQGKAATLRSSEAEKFRRMALAKTLKFPKRQFIGQSAELNRRIAIMLTKKIKEAFKDE